MKGERLFHNHIIKMKIIAFYLPQFHEIPENNEWWGKGFTEWFNVKKAKSLYLNHNQPRIPLNYNYYNLLDDRTQLWQVKLAKKYGIYGFCFYHYWFDGKLLLEKPLEKFLNNKNLDINFCICWANEHWTNTWANRNSKILIEQRYGNEIQWKEHFEYLLPFLKDERYIKNSNKPLIVIYRPEIIDCINEMIDYWRELACENGFEGLDVAYQSIGFMVMPEKDDSRFDYAIEYHPTCVRTLRSMEVFGKFQLVKKNILLFFEKKLRINLRDRLQVLYPLKKENYDDLWEYILNMSPINEKNIPGGFVDWDNTPRRGRRGYVVEGSNPEKFEKYMILQIQHALNIYKKDVIFIFAWNEWAEGGYLEPDQKYQYGHLEALKRALEKTNEFPYQDKD